MDKEGDEIHARGFREEELLRLELRVARRADRIWRRSGCSRNRDLLNWLQAEKEILAAYFGLERPDDAIASPR